MYIVLSIISLFAGIMGVLGIYRIYRNSILKKELEELLQVRK